MFQRCLLPPSSGRWVSYIRSILNLNGWTLDCNIANKSVANIYDHNEYSFSWINIVSANAELFRDKIIADQCWSWSTTDHSVLIYDTNRGQRISGLMMTQIHTPCLRQVWYKWRGEFLFSGITVMFNSNVVYFGAIVRWCWVIFKISYFFCYKYSFRTLLGLQINLYGGCSLSCRPTVQSHKSHTEIYRLCFILRTQYNT
jgi:hypothetical protein